MYNKHLCVWKHFHFFYVYTQAYDVVTLETPNLHDSRVFCGVQNEEKCKHSLCDAVGPGQAQIVLSLWVSERFLEMIYAEHRVITPLLWAITMDTLKPVERVTRSTRKIHSIHTH